jgi:hypothetical protein
MVADPARLAAAWKALADLGVTLLDLRADLDRRPAMPTVAAYVPRVAAAAGPGARRTYEPYWDRMIVAFGDRPLDTVAASDIEALQRTIAASRDLPA